MCCVGRGSVADTALWDLRCLRADEPLWRVAGDFRPSVPLYDTEGGWLQLSEDELVASARASQARGRQGIKIKIGRPNAAEDARRIAAARDAVGDSMPIMVDANQSMTAAEAIRRAALLEPHDIAWFEEPLPAEDVAGHERLAAATSIPVAVGESMYSLGHFGEYLQRGAAGIVQADVAHRRHHALAEGGAPRRGVQRGLLPALPDGAARQPRGRRRRDAGRRPDRASDGRGPHRL